MKVALVGNQNSGKTTLFNYLTGMNAKIGNWPGVTIEKKTGIIKGTNHEITDLPGIYSLSPYSVEEEASRNFVFEEKPDVIINIVDVTSLERSLYLTTQLLELDSRVIIALNMADILEKKGITIDIDNLEKELGVKVFKISALKETGIQEVINQIDKKEEKSNIEIFDKDIEDTLNKINYNKTHKRFVNVKLLENDPFFNNDISNEIREEIKKLESIYDTDLEETIAIQRYKFIEMVKEKCFKRNMIKESISDKLDKIFLNKYLAFPIFILIMFMVYYLSVGLVGSSTVELVGNFVDNLGEKTRIILANAGTSEWLNSLVVDGIIAGVGAVLGFVPQLIILFLCISLLETTGYMSRIALLLDRVFRKIGLSGKSLIPFIVGSGCSVPGIMGSRIIENEDERKMTTILTPFIPCSAKLPIIALFSGYFFGKNSGIVSASLYFFAIAIIIISAILLRKFIYKSTSSTYISELPEYRVPKFKYVLKDVTDKIFEFLKRAGTIILICSIIIWFLLSFSFKLEYGVDIENSILAEVGDKISWIFTPILGTNSWGATVSAIQGLVAKEQVISSMAVISGLSEDVSEGGQIFTGGTFSFFTMSSAYAFMVFNLFSAPCFGAIGAMRRELGGTRRMLKAITFQTILAWVLASTVYQIGSRIERGEINMANLIVISIILLVVISIIINKIKRRGSGCSNCPYSESCDKVK